MGRFLLRALIAAAPLAIVLTIAATCFGQVAPAPVLHAIAAQVAPSPAPDLPPGLNVTDVLNAIAAHQWLALVLLVAVYLRKLLSPGSAFPWTVPVNWRPAIVGAAGLVVAVVSSKQAGSSWESALVIGATGGALTTFLDGLVVALFGSPAAAPAWAKFILGIIEQVAPPAPPASSSGGGGLSVLGGGGGSLSSPPTTKGPTAAARTRGRFAHLVGPLALGSAGVVGAATIAAVPVEVAGCTPAQAANIAQVLQEIIAWVSTFEAGAQALWPLIFSQIPAASQAQASLDFQNSLTTLNDVIATAEEAPSVVTDPTNIAADIQAIQTAVAQLEAIVTLWSAPADGGTTLLSSSQTLANHLTSFHSQSARIRAVRP
jgi:hypothetical protein